MFDIGEDLGCDWLPPSVAVPPEEVIDCLVEEWPGVGEPVRWSEYAPDGLLADMLSRPGDVDPEHREFESLERVGAWERVIAWAQAGQVRAMTSFMRDATARNTAMGAHDMQAHESAVAEVGLMLATSARTAACRVGDAWSLCTRLPATLAALEQGRITLAKARIIDAETVNLSEEHTAAVERLVLAKARKQTPGQLRAATSRAVLTADPAAARKRAEGARRERGVRMWPEPDGMATLSAYLPAAEATGMFAVLDEHARQTGSPADERSMDARRADALVDLVLTPTGSRSAGTSTTQEPATQEPATHEQAAQEPDSSGGARDDVPAPEATSPASRHCECGRPRRGTGVDIRVTIPYTALLGAEDQPGELAGYGPIPAAVARDLAAGGTWRRILTDPASGRPVDYGTTRYRPPAHLAGLVITRDQTCQFPGCRIPAHRCDLDHNIAHNPDTGTGPTSETNLGPKCRRHHQVKQTPGWSVTQHPDGCTTWSTPSGHVYHSQPPPLTDPEPLTTHPIHGPEEPPPF
ncbi:MAG: DUF222 domain-containing protein [Pseudonocardiaceae bacterium]